MSKEQLIIIPTLFLVCLPILALFVLFVRRMKGLQKGELKIGYFKTLGADQVIKTNNLLEQSTRNFINQFEIPVLYYALVPLLLYFSKVDDFFIYAAWVFVATRYIHAVFHLTNNKIPPRAISYAVGVLTVLIMWFRFAILVLG